MESWRGKSEIMENAYKCCTYMIDGTRLHPLSLGELGGGVQCFGEFGASGRARTMKIGRRVGEIGRASCRERVFRAV